MTEPEDGKEPFLKCIFQLVTMFCFNFVFLYLFRSVCLDPSTAGRLINHSENVAGIVGEGLECRCLKQMCINK